MSSPSRPRTGASSKEAPIPTASKHDNYQNQLSQFREAANTVLERASARLLSEVLHASAATQNDGDESEYSPPALDESIAHGVVKGVFEWLRLQMSGVLDEMSDSYQWIGKQIATELKVSYEMKLSHSRTAAKLELKNKAVEMESTFHRQLEDRVKEVAGESGEALVEAHRQIEEMTIEMNTLKLKFTGIENVRAQTRHGR